MKVLLINSVCGYGSTGKICADLAEALISRGDDALVAYGRGRGDTYLRGKDYSVRIGSDTDVLLHGAYTRMTDRHGFGSAKATKRLIKQIREYDPDVINIHNLHGYYINIKILFDYLRESGKPVIWTLHDCWAFTGHCTYFDMAGCSRWETGCGSCPQKSTYPRSSVLDRSKKNYRDKAEIFSGLDRLTVVTPSNWLKELAGRSFLKDYPVSVIPNGVNTRVFYKRGDEEVRKALPPGIEPGRYLLGAANEWEPRKGLEDFVKLAGRIGDMKLPIVLVGLSKERADTLPEGLIGLARTDSPAELAALYSGCSAYLNLSYEENYPTTNIEASSCGADVISYCAGGAEETLSANGRAVAKGDLDSVEKLVRSLPLEPNLDAPCPPRDICSCMKSYLELFHRVSSPAPAFQKK